MKAYIGGRPDKDMPPEFQSPANIVFLAVDISTGAVLAPETAGAVHEAFIAGTQPGGLSRPDSAAFAARSLTLHRQAAL